MAEIYDSATEYLANAITFTRGTVDDITSVGVYHTTNANEVPTELQFTAADLVYAGGPTKPELAEGSNIDIVSLIGPGVGGLSLAAGVYQRWVMIKTANETIIRKVDTLTVIGTTP